MRKATKQLWTPGMGLLLIASILSSCVTSKTTMDSAIVVDLVCSMKINRSDAFTYKYKDKKYYFDTYNCKESFKMNPEKFITNNCTVK